jgi:predicted RNase H-like nuclease
VLQAAARDQYREACDLNLLASGKRLSRQSHAILPKIAHVDALMEPPMQEWIREAHPEVAFATLNGGHSVSLNKRTIEGQRRRLQLLRAAGLRITATDLLAERLRLGPARVKPDDLIDAVACLTVARRIARGVATRFPLTRPEDRDSRGLRMEIWG